ncbi:MAG: hypothetical protein J7L75_03850, partial [Thermoproteales archaeon]|nr:hypothetical protein [Thermoproteales archaeon]
GWAALEVRGRSPLPPKGLEELICLLEALAVEEGLKPPVVYLLIFFERDEEVEEGELVKVSDDVLIGEGVIAVKRSELLPLVVERLALGYYSLSLFNELGSVPVSRAQALVRGSLWRLLTLLSR